MGGVLAEEGIELFRGVRHLRGAGGPGCRRVHLEVAGRERVVEAADILLARGRQPGTDARRLDQAGARVGGAGGEVPLDAELRTNVPYIFAAGDVTAGPQFVSVAAYEGGVAAENACPR